MRRITYFLLASGLVWAGCVGNATLGTSATAQRNVENLARVSLGMNENQVFRIMRQPYKSESHQIEEDRYEVWFYVTRPTIMDQTRMVSTNLTPLTFKNGVLHGMGYQYYKSIIRKEAVASQMKSKPETEDLQMEKALQAPTPAPQEQTQPPGTAPRPTRTPSTQPQPQQPPAPVQPPPPQNPQATPQPAPQQGGTKPGNQPAGQKKQNQKGKVSMSKKPATADKPPEKPPEKQSDKQSEKKVPLTEKDQQMIDEEQEGNFDFW
ncbi:MAG: DUF3192 domain-containing protein [Verrucomicrobia bacterium]|nr:DUF3192 domain-containing protein [Verrucomicrobiota bacterium]